MDKLNSPIAVTLGTGTPELFDSACKLAADLLKQGQLVALPTETVYGLAANAFDARAVERIYEAKGRPKHNPIIVHVAGIEMARECVAEWPSEAEDLSRVFWPGPLTLVLPRSSRIPDIVTAGGNTVGIRWPSHPIMQEVIRRCGFPLAAPSANPANRVSPTAARHVAGAIGDRIPLIVDGGQCQVGIESTVLDLTRRPAIVLRPGMIELQALARILPVRGPGAEPEARLKSPGLLPKHYAPRAKLVLTRWIDDADLADRIRHFNIPNQKCHVIAFDHIPREVHVGRVAVIPNDPEAYARALYSEIHRCDQDGAELILVEEPPETAIWQGVRDRLKRASA